MSDIAVSDEIRVCENQISMKAQEIAKLSATVEAQEYAIRALGTRADELFGELGEKDGKIGGVAAHDAKAVLSVRFFAAMDAEYTEKKSLAARAAAEMEEGMRRELRENVDETDKCEQELARLKSRLSALYAEYTL